jgi:hypothetical protein
MSLAEGGHGGEVEGGEGLARRQSRLVQMTGDASLIPIRDLVLAQRSEEARRTPTLLVGLYGKSFPKPTDRRQAEHG